MTRAPDQQAPARFTWPPRPDAPVEVVLPPEPAPAQSPPAGRLAEWWRLVERDWLAPTALPLARRAAESGWAPDPPEAYCQRCAASIGPFEPDEFGCAHCRHKRPPWSFAARLGLYEGDLAAWIREVKFHQNRWLGAALGAELARAMRRLGLPGRDLAVVPVPTSRRRRLSRGVDHTLALARGVARELRAPVVPALRRRHRPSQLSMAVSERQANVSGAFFPVARRTRGLAGRTIILVDDVTTTGATIWAASRALHEGGVDRSGLWIGVLGVAPDPHRRPRGPRVDKAAL